MIGIVLWLCYWQIWVCIYVCMCSACWTAGYMTEDALHCTARWEHVCIYVVICTYINNMHTRRVLPMDLPWCPPLTPALPPHTIDQVSTLRITYMWTDTAPNNVSVSILWYAMQSFTYKTELIITHWCCWLIIISSVHADLDKPLWWIQHHYWNYNIILQWGNGVM